MEDLFIKKTGNSRKLKTVSNALSKYPTYEDFMRAMVRGDFPIDLLGLNPDGVQQMGTGYQKRTVLPETTAEKYGLDRKGGTVAQVFEKLTGAVFHKAGELLDVSGKSIFPIWTDAFASNGIYPATYKLPWTPRFAFLIGWASNGQRAFTFVRGGSGDAITVVGKSGLVNNYYTRFSDGGITIRQDSGGPLAGAHNVSGRYEYIIAVR